MKQVPLFLIALSMACDGKDNPGGGERLIVGWQVPAQTASEADGSVIVPLVLSRKADVEISVPLTVGGSAVSPDDHDRTRGTVRVPAGASAADVAVQLVDDLQVEGTETIVLTLGAPSAGELGTPSTHTITLLDNEAALTVVAPNGGEVWLAGDQETILWTSLGGSGPVDVEITLDNGTTWAAIATASPDDGEEDWTVPATASTSARVRVTQGDVSDQSDGVFEIRVPGSRWYVDADAAGGDGTTWGTAFASVQEAADVVAANDEIWVAEGTYSADSGDTVVLGLPEQVTWLGGFAGDETDRDQRQPEASITVLDGEGTADHVLIGATGAVLDGFTIRGGAATNAGGGLFNHSVNSMSVRNCRFENNSAQGSGGAVYNETCAGLYFQACQFTGNQASSGAALANVDSQLLVRDCTVEGNEATTGAGGIDNRDSTVVIAATRIQDNQSQSLAGGVVTRDADRTTLVDCVLTRNSGRSGGAVHADGYELAVRRSLLHDNRGDAGGAIFAVGTSVEVSSSTVVENVSDSQPGVLDGSGGAFRVINSILWDNASGSFGESGSSFAVSHSNLQKAHGYIDGGHNQSTSPNFAGGYRLGQASPCIDAGDASAAFTVDALGQVRVDDTGMPDTGTGWPPADLGAFEFPGTTQLRLLAPNGGETWEVGNPTEITWESDGTVAEVQLELLCAGETPRELTAIAAGPDGAFTWDPAVGPGNPRCRVRVTAVADPSLWDESDNTFRLASTRIWYVDASADTAGDGSSWATAGLSVQAAVDGATFGDEVRVAGGGYGAVSMKEGVDLLGGYDPSTGARDIAAHPTLLSGGGSRRAVVGADALIEGFRIEQGRAGVDNHGGGMLIDNVSPTVRQCTFRNNQAGLHGGALFVTGRQARPVIEDCWFESNTATNGGCVYAADESEPTFTDTMFQNCSAPLGYGGALGSNGAARPVLDTCTFTDNQASNGGALGLFDVPGAEAGACTWVNNTAAQHGGAVQLTGGSLTVRRSWLEGNEAGERGGAFYVTEFGRSARVEVESSVLVRNQASGTESGRGGGALYLANTAGARLTNCTAFENTTFGLGGAAYVSEGTLTIVNSILWADTDASSALGCPPSGPDSAELFVDSGSIALSFSDVTNRCEDNWAGPGNLDADPLFIDTGTPVDLHLDSSSPCIDIAHGDYLPATDYDGETPFDHAVANGGSGTPSYGDIGAFEYVP